MGFINHANKPLKEPRNHRLKVGSLDFLGAVGNNIPETQPPGLHCDDAFVVSFLGPLGPIPRQLYFPKNPNGLSMAVVGPDTKTQGSGPEPNPMCLRVQILRARIGSAPETKQAFGSGPLSPL